MKKRIRQAGSRSCMAPQPLRQGERQRRPPERLQAGQRNQQTSEYVFYVDLSEMVYTWKTVKNEIVQVQTDIERS